MAKNYVVSFGGSNYTGLAPTFLVFQTVAGVSTTRPGITEIPTASGLYYFTYGPTNTIAFVMSGATTGIPQGQRYISGALDPIQAVDEQVTALGSTMQAIGSTLVGYGASSLVQGASILTQGASILTQGASILAAISSSGNSAVLAIIGTTASSFGDTSTMPATVFGYLKRLKEFNEGVSDFTKSTGVWQVFSGEGTTTQLFQRTLSDTSGNVSKS